MKGNALVYQVYPVSRITGEGGAEFSRVWGPGCNKSERGGEGGATQSVRGKRKSFNKTNMTVLEGMHQFIKYIL